MPSASRGMERPRSSSTRCTWSCVAKGPYIDGWLRGWRLRTTLRNPIAFIIGNWRFLKIFREFKPTHIHALNPIYVLSFVAALALVRTPMIYRAGDKPIMHRWIWRIVWRFVVARTCCFVPVSNFIAGALKATGVKPQQMSRNLWHPAKARRKRNGVSDANSRRRCA